MELGVVFDEFAASIQTLSLLVVEVYSLKALAVLTFARLRGALIDAPPFTLQVPVHLLLVKSDVINLLLFILLLLNCLG